jgi:integrase
MGRLSLHLPPGPEERGGVSALAAAAATQDRGEALGVSHYFARTPPADSGAGRRAGGAPSPRRAVTFGEVCERFVRECPMFLDNDAHVQADARTRLLILRAVIGDRRDVQTLTRNDVQQYEARRKLGGIPYGNDKVTEAERQRSVQADVKLLKQALSWACSVSWSDGTPLLERNPLAAVQVRGEHDVRRPVASHERFEATRAAMRRLQQRYAGEARVAESEGARALAGARQRTWVRAEFALLLLEATGRRRGAIMGLKWQDFDGERQRITWRPGSSSGASVQSVGTSSRAKLTRTGLLRVICCRSGSGRRRRRRGCRSSRVAPAIPIAGSGARSEPTTRSRPSPSPVGGRTSTRCSAATTSRMTRTCSPSQASRGSGRNQATGPSVAAQSRNWPTTDQQVARTERPGSS